MLMYHAYLLFVISIVYISYKYLSLSVNKPVMQNTLLLLLLSPCKSDTRQPRNTLCPYTIVMDKNKPFACDICGKSFKQKIVMTNHRRIHIGEKPYGCEICKMTFSYRTTLANHKRIHTGEKPYECDVCKKTLFKKVTQLSIKEGIQEKNHMNVNL